ncbi:MAG: FMN-binding glutamate synthase family protein [Thermodesulfobacteriota bacterium]|nr:MAG: FMN-binding glutamate synthase family protein [Thermodesulfobacteriota bacterium]
MSLSKANVSPATLTRNRVKCSPGSGICVTCLDGCPGLCEVGRSAIRGRENLYPQPFGQVTAGSEKDYPNDFSYFNIQGTCVGAVGVEADSDKATFPAVDVTTEFGAKHKIKLRFPVFTGAVGSTEIGRIHWEGMAIGAAISGILVVAGENICGMDMEAQFKNGKVVRSPEMERRVKTFQKWYEGYGGIIVQANVEDTRLGVPEYVIEKLGVEIFELKWGQGAKDIGGEVKIPDLKKALELKKRNYIVLPDPADPVIQKAFNNGAFNEFERHSRLGMVEEEGFYKTVDHLRKVGAKYVTLKTGAYRPADLARAVKFASEARIDLLTIDGAGGGTGMSPWRMMNEWGVPTVQLECLLYDYLKRLDAKGKFIPDCAIAGGLSLEDHIFKAVALGSPYVKAVCMGRSVMTAAMVGNTQVNLLKKKMEKDIEKDGEITHHFDEVSHLVKKGDWVNLEDIFITSPKLKEKYGKDFKLIPPGAIGVYTYIDRLTQGLQQLMAGTRKFALRYITREDICALTREAAEMSGITYVMDADREEVDKILG